VIGLFKKFKYLGPHLLAGILLFALHASVSIAFAYDITLAWDPNSEPDLGGYIVYVNKDASDTSFYQLDAVSMDEIEPDKPRYTVVELEYDVDYCFAVTAYDAEGFESYYSNTVCVRNGRVHDSQDVAPNASLGGGAGGGGCFISLAIGGGGAGSLLYHNDESTTVFQDCLLADSSHSEHLK